VPSRSDEAIVLARYPFRERDLVVTLLTRQGGQVRVLARHVRGARSSRASALEPLAGIRVSYFERRHSELATLDEAELVRSAFALAGSPAGWAAGQVVAELALGFCPPGERLEAPYRLVDRCLGALLAGTPPLAVAGYAELWFLKLSGVLPELDRCGACGEALPPGPRTFDAGEGSFVCGRHPGLRAVERIGADAEAWLRGALRGPVEAAGEPPADAASWLIGVVQRFTGKEILSWRYLRKVAGLRASGMS
jgi:DNA repair protein RecO (recombination protein O)